MEIEALKKVIEAVEAGDLNGLNNTLGRVFAPPDDWPWDWISKINSAFKGSLDAAMALHDALLPGWHWTADDGQGHYSPFWHVFQFDGGGVGEGEAETPARAWLIAILEAKLTEAKNAA